MLIQTTNKINFEGKESISYFRIIMMNLIEVGNYVYKYAVFCGVQ